MRLRRPTDATAPPRSVRRREGETHFQLSALSPCARVCSALVCLGCLSRDSQAHPHHVGMYMGTAWDSPFAHARHRLRNQSSESLIAPTAVPWFPGCGWGPKWPARALTSPMADDQGPRQGGVFGIVAGLLHHHQQPPLLHPTFFSARSTHSGTAAAEAGAHGGSPPARRRRGAGANNTRKHTRLSNPKPKAESPGTESWVFGTERVVNT